MIRLSIASPPPELNKATVLILTAEFARTGNRVWDKPYIRSTLLASSNNKCAYCECNISEESKYMEVEHFRPKAKHPLKVVDWDNLLPSCKRCNINKGAYDVDAEGDIINPFYVDPKDHVYFQNSILKYKDDIGRRTIEVCNLNETDRLLISRFRITAIMHQSLEKTRTDLETYLSGQKTTRLKNKIVRSIEEILKQTKPDAAYSAAIASALIVDQTYTWLKAQMSAAGLWDNLIEIEKYAIQAALTD